MANVITPERDARGGGAGLSYWLGTKVLGAPLAMLPLEAQALKLAIDNRSFDPQAGSLSLAPQANRWTGVESGRSRYRVTDDKIAIVPVAGLLLDRGDWLGDLWGMATTYEGLTEQIRRIVADSEIKSVIFDIDSGGGMVSGLFDLCQDITSLAKKKPVYAIAQNCACSAAYAIAACARETFVTRNGEAGSIGVIVMHQSYQRMLDSAGIDTTIIHAGSHKAAGNPYQQLSHTARADMSATIDEIYSQFVRHVAKTRGIDEDAVRATEARVYSGQKAVDLGLADGVKSFDELLATIRKGKPPGQSRRSATSTTGANMTRRNNDDDGAQMSAADADAIISAYERGLKKANTPSGGASAAHAAAAPVPAAAPAAATPAAHAPSAGASVAHTATAQGAADATSRVQKILTSDVGKKRPQLAQHVAFNRLEMSAEDALAMLAAVPEESAADAGGLLGAMRKPGSSAGIKPDASSSATAQGQSPSAGMKSLADVVKAKTARPQIQFGR